MPFSPVTWVNKVTKLGPTNLNRIEQGIDDAHAGLLDALAIGTGVIADLAVTTGKLAALAVTTAKLDDLAVTTGKIAANAVTAAKIAADTITANEIAANAIGASELADNAVDTAAIADAAVTRTELATVTRKADCPVLAGSAAAPSYPDGANNYRILLAVVPDDYVSGDITFKSVRIAEVGSGTAVMVFSSYRMRDGVANFNIDNGADISFTPGDTVNHVFSRTIGASNFASGDALYFAINRDGAAGGDTLAGYVDMYASWIEYTGRA